MLPGAVFLFLFVFNLQLAGTEITYAVAHEPTAGTVSLIVNRIMSVSFSGMLALLYVFRPPAATSLRHPLAVAAAFYGSFVMLALRPLGILLEAAPDNPVQGTQIVISNLVIAIGLAFSVYALMYLKFNFSIIPESRTLTLDGPYRIVRHPVYLGEVISGVGLVLALPSWFGLLLLLSFVGAQLIRIHFEEKLLAREHPEYAEYAGKTKRLLPWVV